MTAARDELRRLVSASVMLSVDVGRMGGDGTALDRVSKYVRRMTHCFEGRHIVQDSGYTVEGEHVAAHQPVFWYDRSSVFKR